MVLNISSFQRRFYQAQASSRLPAHFEQRKKGKRISVTVKTQGALVTNNQLGMNSETKKLNNTLFVLGSDKFRTALLHNIRTFLSTQFLLD